MSQPGPAASYPDSPRTFLDWLRLWFLLRDPVIRRDYAITGFGLMAFKYIVEFLVVGQLSGHLYTPIDFINPLFSARERMTQGAPEWFGFAWVVWALPFLWISVGMSVRRAMDAGISAWNGLWVLVPFANLIAMLVLAVLTSATEIQELLAAEAPSEESNVGDTLKAAIGGIAVGALYACVLVQVSVYVFHDYGMAMFFGTPFIIGVASSYIHNLRTSRTYSVSIIVATVALFMGGVALMLFAFEGVICIAMAAPIVLPVGILGAPIGKLLADRRRRRLHGGFIGALLVVPLFAAIESQLPRTNEFVIASSIDIAAPPEKVWQNVVGFSKITEPPEWLFRMGIACPSEAQIIGAGVGAERHCIFTTGEFVEPITVWDEPRRLAFDVREQPDPMIELTPYRDIHPPHLDLAFHSVRGEFKLVELKGGHTRLTGRTWYTLDIHPHAYWTIWSDWLVHRIHQRVLRHIKGLSEAGEKAS